MPTLNYLAIAPAVADVEAAVAARDLPSLEKAAVSLAAVIGLDAEATEVVAVVEDCRAGNWSAAVKDVYPLLEEALDAAIGHHLFGAGQGEFAPLPDAQLDAARAVRKAMKAVKAAGE